MVHALIIQHLLQLRRFMHVLAFAQRELTLAGELYDQIQKRKQIDVQDVRIYAAEIVLMLQMLRQEKASLLTLTLL